MFASIAGVYRNGKIELAEAPIHLPNASQVIVIFLAPTNIALRQMDLDQTQAAELRSQLAPFAEDWTSPDMDVYDHYV